MKYRIAKVQTICIRNPLLRFDTDVNVVGPDRVISISETLILRSNYLIDPNATFSAMISIRIDFFPNVIFSMCSPVIRTSPENS